MAALVVASAAIAGAQGRPAAVAATRGSLTDLGAADQAITGRIPWGDRGDASVSGTVQPSSSFSETVRPIQFVESSIVDTNYKTRTISGFDVAGGVRVWRNLAIGVDVSFFSKTIGGDVSAQVPHPFFFNRLRAVSGAASGLTRDETAAHVQALWMIPLRTRWQLSLAGGRSWFVVGQDLVSGVAVAQTFPYDTATFAAPTTVHRTGSRLGYNAAADLSYRLRRHVGLGVGAMFSHAAIPIDDTLTVDAGGGRIAAGQRFRF
ncbi:MAG: hypothetical protein JWL71_4608 [Acidobacteria bacterium]|nr:hypothetical protein [Acidobacteriota bacterium]